MDCQDLWLQGVGVLCSALQEMVIGLLQCCMPWLQRAATGQLTRNADMVLKSGVAAYYQQYPRCLNVFMMFGSWPLAFMYLRGLCHD
jgi:hypothetical protein